MAVIKYVLLMDKWQEHISISERGLEMLHFPPNNESKLLERISDHIIEFVCGYATCATLVVYEYFW